MITLSLAWLSHPLGFLLPRRFLDVLVLSVSISRFWRALGVPLGGLIRGEALTVQKGGYKWHIYVRRGSRAYWPSYHQRMPSQHTLMPMTNDVTQHQTLRNVTPRKSISAWFQSWVPCRDAKLSGGHHFLSLAEWPYLVFSALILPDFPLSLPPRQGSQLLAV